MLSQMDTKVSLAVKVLWKFISLICFRVYLEVKIHKNPTCFSRWSVRDLQEIEKQDFILTPGRYVEIEEQEEDSEPFEEKMTRLTSELSVMFAKSRELEEEIRKKLGAIGYEM